MKLYPMHKCCNYDKYLSFLFSLQIQKSWSLCLAHSGDYSHLPGNKAVNYKTIWLSVSFHFLVKGGPTEVGSYYYYS